MKQQLKLLILFVFITQGLNAQIIQEDIENNNDSDVFSNNISSCVEEFDNAYKIKHWAYYDVNMRYKHCLDSRSYHKLKSTLQAMIISKKYVLIKDGNKVIKVNRKLFTKFNQKLKRN